MQWKLANVAVSNWIFLLTCSWLSGVTYISSPQVWACCLRYLFSSSIQERQVTCLQNIETMGCLKTYPTEMCGKWIRGYLGEFCDVCVVQEVGLLLWLFFLVLTSASNLLKTITEALASWANIPKKEGKYLLSLRSLHSSV